MIKKRKGSLKRKEKRRKFKLVITQILKIQSFIMAGWQGPTRYFQYILLNILKVFVHSGFTLQS